MSSSLFSPSTNLTSNFRERLLALRSLLVDEGLSETPEYSAITKLFGYDRAVSEEVFSGVVLRMAQAGRNDLVPALANFLSEFELGRIGPALLQARHDEALGCVLPMLSPAQFSSLVYACLTRRDDVFDLMKPFLSPTHASTSLVSIAAAHQAHRFGRYFVEHMDVLAALREIKTPTVSAQVASWWAEAIESKRVPVPNLGRAAKVWRKKFPELGAVLTAMEMEASLPPATLKPRVRM